MAYVNVADWKPDQVADWLKGLDVSIHRYVESFLNNHVNGQHLLNLQPDDLEHHGIFKVGHQEIILEAVDHLRNFHYELDHENLQLLALRVSSVAHSLHRELWNSSPVVSTQNLSDIATIIKAVKPLVCWLDRPPFSGQLAYIDKKAELLRLSLEMATSGQRDRFAERPIETIRTSAKRLAELADEMIREIHDPLLLQPASLDLATLKKRPGDHLGFCIIPSFHGNHQIGEIKCNSTAYQSGKIECGDEIVQINYQTVVGWEVKQVMALFEESSSDIFLTLKKRPCHSKILGQIYMKPYRLPSKKVSYSSKWFLGDNISPPRINMGGHFDIKPLGNQLCNSVSTFGKTRKPLPEAIVIPKEDSSLDNEGTTKIIKKEEEEEEEEGEQEEEEESISSPTSVRLYLPKPRLPVQRRATITGTGASPTSKRAPLNLEQLWHELKLEREWRLSGKQRKGEKSNSEILLSAASASKSASTEGQINMKITTKASSADCLKSVHADFSSGNKVNMNVTSTKFIAENDVALVKDLKEKEKETTDSNTSTSKDTVLNFMPLKERIEILNKNIDSSNSGISSVKPKVPARKFIQNDGFFSLTNSPVHRPTDKKPVARPRGKLDKANSTPVYDFNDRSLSSSAIEEFLTDELKNKNHLRPSNTSRHKSASEQIEVGDEMNILSKRLIEQSSKPTSNLGTSELTPTHFNDALLVKPKLFPPTVDANKEVKSLEGSKSIVSNVSTQFVQDPSYKTIWPQKDTKVCMETEMEAPKPAVRIIKREPSKSACDTLNKTLNSSESISPISKQLGSDGMHLSESKDSVFIDDDTSTMGQHQKRTENTCSLFEQSQAIGNNGSCLSSPDRKSPCDNIQKTRQTPITSIVLRNNDEIKSPKIKFANDAQSPSFSSSPKHILTDSTIKIREQSKLEILPNSSTIQISSSSSPINSLNVSEKTQKPLASKMCTRFNPATRSLPPEPLNKEELFRKFLSGTQSSISYSPDNRVHVNIPPCQPNYLKTDLSASSSAETINKAPFACSTPIKQFSQETSFCQQPSTYPRKKPEMKPVQTSPSSSISHNSSLRAMVPLKTKHKPTSPKVFRKKNSLLRGKRRNVSLKELVMPDCEGWLFQRDRKISTSTVPPWIRGWFVIVGNNFYGFTDKESSKANLFIYLPGFTVSPAVEVKSRKYALKIYHAGTTFYLAADSQDEYATWLNCLSLAIIAHDRSPVENITFSESEGEDKSEDKSDSDKGKDHCFSSPKVKKMSTFFSSSSNSKTDKKFSSLKKKKVDNSSDPVNLSLDRKYLKFLSINHSVPVPTEHFRSYRRVPPNQLKDTSLATADSSVSSNESLVNRTSPPLQLPPDMADYRLASLARAGHTISRQREHNTTLEAFMISRQGEERRQNQNQPNVVPTLIRPPQQFAPSAPNLYSEESVCRQQSVRQSAMASTSQKESECRVSIPEQFTWSDHFRQGSSRNCNTIPDTQTKRLKKIGFGSTNVQAEDDNSLFDLEEANGTQFMRNTQKSSSSSKLKSFFSSSHWQDSSSKGILGSPRLRRVLFREKSDASSRQNIKVHPLSNIRNESTSSIDLTEHPPDYPGLEYPPVFVPESYSLSYVTSLLEARAHPGNSNNDHDNEDEHNEQPDDDCQAKQAMSEETHEYYNDT